MVHEENPALGWRAIRLTLDRPGLLRTQIRALLKAAGGRELRLMLPMVTEIGEIMQARELIDREVLHLSRFAHDLPTLLKLGAMIEVRAALATGRVDANGDFVGGSKRSVPVRERRPIRQYAAWPSIRCRTTASSNRADAGHRVGTPVTLCGELAGRAISAMALIGLGYRSISMSPAAIGPVKAMLTEVPLEALTALLDEALAKPNAVRNVRKDLHAFADAHGIPL